MTPSYILIPALAAALLLSRSIQQKAEALTAPRDSIGETSNPMLTSVHWYHGGEGWHRYYGWRGYYGHDWHGLYVVGATAAVGVGISAAGAAGASTAVGGVIGGDMAVGGTIELGRRDRVVLDPRGDRW